jgi:O-antigen ligase
MTLLITIAFLLKQNKKYFITTLSIFFILLFFYGKDILNLFGRDMTLSGRTFMWLDIFSQGISFPMIGMGLNNASLLIDSTYIKMIIETGFVFTLCYFIWILVQFFKNLYISKKISDSLIFLILIFYSIVESVGAIYSTNLLILVMLIVYFNKFIDKKSPEEY